uniref:Uncharacterized protein n=1 Tax=Amphimedon queenslandica TaxID=400682 RepID=A0A1X7TYT3_AMPQE
MASQIRTSVNFKILSSSSTTPTPIFSFRGLASLRTPMAGAFSTSFVFLGVIILSSANVSLALGLKTKLALHSSVTFNQSSSCPSHRPHVTLIVNSTIINDNIKKIHSLTTNVNVTDCCPSYAFAEVTVPGIPSNNKLVIAIVFLCGNNISAEISSSWQIFVQGITPARDVRYNNGLLLWSDPYFHSDVPQPSVYTYTIMVDGIVIYYNITATSVWLNVSYCLMEFNVSIETFLYKYQSTENITIQNNNYTVELVDATYIPMKRTIDANITFKACYTIVFLF